VFELRPGSRIILDLDDTLYSERDFERSGFATILDVLDVAHTVELDTLVQLSIQGQDIFTYLDFDTHLKSVALSIYRSHKPSISLYADAAIFIEQALKAQCQLVLATEGRSVTQRNKIGALGLTDSFSQILISEEVGQTKVHEAFFADLDELPQGTQTVMIGDNPIKDFLVPNRYGWDTYMLASRGNNVHRQDIDVDDEYHAKHIIHSFSELRFSA